MDSEGAGLKSRVRSPIDDDQPHDMSVHGSGSKITRLFQSSQIARDIHVPVTQEHWSPKPFQALPGEVNLIILNLLATSENIRYSGKGYYQQRLVQTALKTLRSVCLVSRHMDALCRPILYQEISVYNADVLIRLVPTIANRRDLAELVKHISLKVPFYKLYSYLYTTPADIPTIRLDDALHQLRKAVSDTSDRQVYDRTKTNDSPPFEVWVRDNGWKFFADLYLVVLERTSNFVSLSIHVQDYLLGPGEYAPCLSKDFWASISSAAIRDCTTPPGSSPAFLSKLTTI